MKPKYKVNRDLGAGCWWLLQLHNMKQGMWWGLPNTRRFTVCLHPLITEHGFGSWDFCDSGSGSVASMDLFKCLMAMSDDDAVKNCEIFICKMKSILPLLENIF